MDHLSKYNNIDDIYRKKIVDFLNKEIDSIDISRKIEIIDLDDRKHTGTLAKVSKASFEIKWQERQPKKIGKGKVTVAFTKNFNFGEYKKVQIILN